MFTYQTLSEYFLEYVRTRVNRDDSLKIWSELIDAEKRLRAVVETGLRSKYGEDSWIATLENLAESEEKVSYSMCRKPISLLLLQKVTLVMQ